jgi:hypothetical protein
MYTTQQHINPTQAQQSPQHESQSVKAYPSRTIVHAKLEMTEPGDHDEQEADAMADTVVSGGKIARKISSGGSSSGIAVSQQMESQLSQLQGGGRPMPQGLLNMMESGFGQDFGQVRIHTDAEAADMSSSIGARAFTLGNDIYFNRGQFSPETTEGQRLVAHELTHVVQGTGKVGRKENKKKPYVNRQRAFEAELEYAFQGKYLSAFYKLLEFYGYYPDNKTIDAIGKAYFHSVRNNHSMPTSNKSAFFKFIRFGYGDSLYDSVKASGIADTLDNHDLFSNIYEKKIREEYTRIFEEQIDSNCGIDSNLRTTYSYNLFKEKEKTLLDNKGNTIGLKYIDYLITKRHHNKIINSAEYLVTPDNLITGKSWTTIFFAINAALFSPIISALSTGVVIATVLSVVKSAVSTAVDEAIKYKYGSEEEREGMTAGTEAFKIFRAALLDGLTAGFSTKLSSISEETKDVVKKALIKIINLEIDALKDLLNYISDALILNKKTPKEDLIAGYIKTLVLSLVPIFNDNAFAKETTDAGITFTDKVSSL